MTETPEPKRGPGRPRRPDGPDKPRTAGRIGRVWDDAKLIADHRDEKMTAIIEAALRRYVQRHQAVLEQIQRDAPDSMSRSAAL